MKEVTVIIKIAGEPAEAIPIVKALGAAIKGAVPATHRPVIKYIVRCKRCGDPLVLRDGGLVCDTCLRDEALEAMEDRALFTGLRPIATAEEPAELAF